MKKTVEVVVLPDGTIEMEAHGYKGDGCEAALKDIAGGLKKKGIKKKAEYYSKAPGLKKKV